MPTITRECELDVERGPDWLLVRVGRLDPAGCEASALAERIWRLLQQHFTYRLVLELDQVRVLNSHLVGQLVQLYRWIAEHDGVMRVCGLSLYNRQLLHACRLDEQLLPYQDREEAVTGVPHPQQPR
jgi:anti-anti-sigma factor